MDAENEFSDIIYDEQNLKFINDLNNDSILELSFLEKQVFYLFKCGLTDKDINRLLNINMATIRNYRRRLRKQYAFGKAIVSLVESMNIDVNPEYNFHTEQKSSGLAVTDEDGMVIGFHTIVSVHNSDRPLRHASSIVLCVRYDEDCPRFAICEKTYGRFRKEDIVNKKLACSVDIVGGHVRKNDVKDGIGSKLDRAVFDACAVREINEEISGTALSGITINDLKFIDYDYFYGHIFPGGVNDEYSAIYLYVIPSNVKDNQIRMYDDWIDSNNVRYKHRYNVRMVTWERLSNIANGKDAKYQPMNALKRACDRISSDELLYKTICER